MRKRDHKRIADALAAARARYMAEVEKIALQARAAMLPYFERRRLDYTAGNGTWLIDRDGAGPLHDRIVEDGALPVSIRSTLYLEVEPGQPLGFWISDIRTREP